MSRISLFFLLLFRIKSVVCQQIDTTIYYPNGTYYSKGLFDLKKHKRIGIWELYDIDSKLISKLIPESPPFWKIIPVRSDSSITSYYWGFFRGDTIVHHGDYYYEENVRKLKGRYKENIPYGVWENYRSNNLSSITIYNSENYNEHQILLFDHETGELTYMNTLNGNRSQGLNIKFEDFGQIQEIGTIENSCKINEWSYYKDGILVSRGKHYPEYFTMQPIEDRFQIVNKDTIPAEQLYSKELIQQFDLKTYAYYFKDGKWDYYFDDGSIMKIELYDKGLLKKVKTFKKGRKFS